MDVWREVSEDRVSDGTSAWPVPAETFALGRPTQDSGWRMILGPDYFCRHHEHILRSRTLINGAGEMVSFLGTESLSYVFAYRHGALRLVFDAHRETGRLSDSPGRFSGATFVISMPGSHLEDLARAGMVAAQQVDGFFETLARALLAWPVSKESPDTRDIDKVRVIASRVQPTGHWAPTTLAFAR